MSCNYLNYKRGKRRCFSGKIALMYERVTHSNESMKYVLNTALLQDLAVLSHCHTYIKRSTECNGQKCFRKPFEVGMLKQSL